MKKLLFCFAMALVAQSLFSQTCQAGFTYRPSTTTLYTIDFSETTVPSGLPNTKTLTRMYFFGDNDSIWGVKNPSHTYPGTGHYIVKYVYSEIDTVTNMYGCHESITDTIFVAGNIAPQYVPLHIQVHDNMYMPLHNQPVWINIYNGNHVETRKGYTDSSMFALYRDSLAQGMIFDSIKSYTYDCNGQEVSEVSHFMLNNQYFAYEDTLYLGCGISAPLCSPGFTAQPSTSSALAVDFADTTSGTGVANAGSAAHIFYFGDGDSAVGAKTISHTYAAPGKYEVRLVYSETDTVNGNLIYKGEYKDSIEVMAAPDPVRCEAVIEIDTANSRSGVVIVYNSSFPVPTDTNYTISYNWDFGDGIFSTQPYPTHTYSDAGTYALCLSIDVDSAGFSCTSTFCDTISVDSLGNLYKAGNTFVLQVRDPATIGLGEESIGSFEVYPNPVNDLLKVSALSGSAGSVEYMLYDLSGIRIMGGYLEDKGSRAEQVLDVSSLSRGVYLLNLQTSDGSQKQFRIIKQ